MASALDSLNKTMTHFVENEYGLGESAEYEKKSTGEVFSDLKIVRQASNFKQRKISNGTQVDYEIFLITLPFLPTKNDKVLKDSNVYYVDTFEIVSQNNYRLYCEANVESVPTPTKSIKL